MNFFSRRYFVTATLLAMAMAGCASLMGPRTVNISREQLLTQLSKPFPMRKTLAEVFDVEAQAPRLQMVPDTNRVAAEFDIQATNRLFSRDYQGTVGLTFGMRYEAHDRTIRLNQVSIDKVAMDGQTQTTQQQWTRLGAMLAQATMQDYPIHQFKPEDLRELDRRGYQVEDLRVTAEGLSIKLVPNP